MDTKRICHQTLDQERALYAEEDLEVISCRFDGPADGESALKESRNITTENCYFNLRYPFWHDTGLRVRDCELTPLCRAALWYSDQIHICQSKLHGIKALRECRKVAMEDCHVESAEFGWFCEDVSMDRVDVTGEYFMLRARRLRFQDVALKGKYSFQYITDSVFENCRFDTKDAFWHARNVTVRNSVVKGEYLAWYSENVTFENCLIIGTQPLCYCKGLRLINCRMEGTDLSFERSEVEATVLSHIDSIKNPLSGSIRVSSVGQIITEDGFDRCRIQVGETDEQKG